jgi:hypothetical protein
MKKWIACIFILTAVRSAAQKELADSLFALQQWKTIVPLYEDYLKTHPNDALEWNRLGFSYQNMENYSPALAAYTHTLDNNPPPPLKQLVLIRMARIYIVQNKKDFFYRTMDSAMAAGYANVQELESNKDFDAVRQDERFKQFIEKVKHAAFPCMYDTHKREFDFWVGEWNVYPAGTNFLGGHSKVEVSSGGCAILENWTALGNFPGTGKSLNYVDPVTGQWRQDWIGSTAGDVQRFYHGEYKDNAMRFEFETTINGVKNMGRFIFFNEGPDQVRQFNEVSADEGKTWTTVYNLVYKRIK